MRAEGLESTATGSQFAEVESTKQLLLAIKLCICQLLGGC